MANNVIESLIALSHSAIRPDLLLVSLGQEGDLEAAARAVGKHGWFVTDASGHVVAEYRFTQPEYRGDHDADVLEP